MEVSVFSKDGQEHEVQIYTDITGGESMYVRAVILGLMLSQNGFRVMLHPDWSGSTAVHSTVSITIVSQSRRSKSSLRTRIVRSGVIL
jgi:hypothetical protein